MNKFADITGEVFGERVVLGFSHQHPKSRNLYWRVRCSCGREDIVQGSKLKKSTTCVSCSNRKNGRKGLYSQSKGVPVYFIGCGEYFKIGCSQDIGRRIKDMEASNPYKVELLGVDKDEEFWHKVFAHRHHRGEWYKRL